jgi:hypothetical protein
MVIIFSFFFNHMIPILFVFCFNSFFRTFSHVAACWFSLIFILRAELLSVCFHHCDTQFDCYRYLHWYLRLAWYSFSCLRPFQYLFPSASLILDQDPVFDFYVVSLWNDSLCLYYLHVLATGLILIVVFVQSINAFISYFHRNNWVVDTFFKGTECHCLFCSCFIVGLSILVTSYQFADVRFLRIGWFWQYACSIDQCTSFLLSNLN